MKMHFARKLTANHDFFPKWKPLYEAKEAVREALLSLVVGTPNYTFHRKLKSILFVNKQEMTVRN